MRRLALVLLVGCASGSDDRKSASAGPLPPICINELQPDNDSTLEVDGLFPDWVELHNPTDADVSLDGWSLSESRDADVALDGLVLEAGAYLVLTASELLETADLPFNLDSDGQDLQLIDPDGGGRRVEWAHIRGDHSAARSTDCCTGDCWQVSFAPSPGAPNP